MSAPFKPAKAIIDADTQVVDAPFEVQDNTIDGSVTADSALVIAETEQADSMVAMGQRTYSSTFKPRADEIQMPKLRLAQGLTPEVGAREAAIGQWLLIGQEPVDEVEIVILKAGKARELRVEESPGNRSVVCRSSDAVEGIGTPGGDCEKCPMAQWVDATVKGQKGTPPLCTLIFSYQAYSLTHDALCVIEFSRTAENQAKLLNTMLVTQGFGGFVAKLKHVSKSNGNRRWVEPQLMSRKITEEQRELVSMFLG